MSCIEDFDIYEGDEGTELILTLRDPITRAVVDLSAATVVEYTFVPPKPGEPFTGAGALKTDGTDGRMVYVTGAGDLVPAGRWKMQAYIETPTRKFRTSHVVFLVKRNLVSAYDRDLTDSTATADELVVS